MVEEGTSKGSFPQHKFKSNNMAEDSRNSSMADSNLRRLKRKQLQCREFWKRKENAKIKNGQQLLEQLFDQEFTIDRC